MRSKNNLTLSRKVIDLLGNHLLPVSTIGTCIFFSPISCAERFPLENVHLPHSHVRADCSLAVGSTDRHLRVSVILLAILGHDFPQITNLLVRVALRPLLTPSVYRMVAEGPSFQLQ